MTKETELAQHIHNLKEMVKIANNPKLLWEEMQILAQKAFKLQEKLNIILNELEDSSTEITAVQMLSDAREMVWDLMNQLTSRELELKNKPHPKNTCHEQTCCCCPGHRDDHKCSCHKHKKESSCSHKEAKATKKGKNKCQK